MKLSGLSLRENYFSGNLTNLPPTAELKWIHLDCNSFETTCFECHTELFSVLKDVVVLGLTDNKLSGKLPVGLGNKWKGVKTLLLGGNKLTGSIPMSLFYAPQLEQLDLSRNNFLGIVNDMSGSNFLIVFAFQLIIYII